MRSLPLCGHHQCGERQLGSHMVAHRPAHDLAGRQVEHGGQIQLAFTGRDIGDVGEPDPVRRGCREALRQQVRRNRKIMTAVGRAGPEPAPGQRADAVPAHQPLDTATATPMAIRPQGGMHSRRPVSPLGGASGAAGHHPAAPGSPSSARLAADRANRNSRCATRRAWAHEVHRSGGRMLLDKGELHRGISDGFF